MSFIHLLQILVLAIVQGAAELLPVSSSAHVTIAARLMHSDLLDDKKIFEWTFLLVMLHSGTMFSVLVYFWRRWKSLLSQIPSLVAATLCTGVVGYPLKRLIEHFLNRGNTTADPVEIEHLFQNLPLMACSLAAVGILIIIAGLIDDLRPGVLQQIDPVRGGIIGAVQGLALPFRGFSRSGSTISAGMLTGIARVRAEEFSFALAVIITPVVIAREVLMLLKQHSSSAIAQTSTEALPSISQLLFPGLLGMAFSFVAGLIALRWLSNWLEHGRWKFFGVYCLIAAGVVLAVNQWQTGAP